jgi:hypothetical protein
VAAALGVTSSTIVQLAGRVKTKKKQFIATGFNGTEILRIKYKVSIMMALK